MCVSHDSCPSDQYCHILVNYDIGSCLPCWACCNFQDRFAPCPSACSSSCSKTTAKGTPGGSFAFFQQYSRSIIARDNDTDSESYIDTEDIEQWLTRQLLEPATKGYNSKVMQPDATSNFASALEASHRTPCPTPTNTTLVLPGCPCSYGSAYGPRCAPGYVCSKNAYTGFTFEMYTHDVSYHILRAICIPCTLGEYCINNQRVKCPAGFYCPSPAIKIECPNGAFCPPGSAYTYPCNYYELLLDTLYVPIAPQSVLERIFVEQDPMIGNYCPVQSDRPGNTCPAGYYCPTPATRIACPAAHFCPSQSSHPRPCPAVSVCPAGSSEPTSIGLPYIVTGVIVFVTLFAFYIRYLVTLLVQIRRNRKEKELRAKQKEKTSKERQLVNPIPPSPPSFPNPMESHEFRQVFGAHSTYSNDNIWSSIVDRDASSKGPSPLEHLSVQNITCPWLKSSSAHFKPCSLNVIIGGSGCGKSTFLEVMRGNVPHHDATGQVMLKLAGCSDMMNMNLNDPSLTTFESFKRLRGYVPQDDVVYGTLTVEENLRYSAHLKLSQRSVDRNHTVAWVISNLGLNGIKDQIVGSVDSRGISGGQRKRVNIGMEIVHMPSLLIMDEPTSGLDANGTQQLTEYMKKLTLANITIVAVVHQPRYTSFELFDHIMLLSKNGCVYQGSPLTSLIYFSHGLGYPIDKNENPADVIMDIISKDYEKLAPQWVNGGQAYVAAVEERYPFHQHALKYDCVFDAETNDVMIKAIKSIALHEPNAPEANHIGQQIRRLFMSVGIGIDNDENDENDIDIVSKFVEDNKIATLDDFRRVMSNVCSSAYLSNRYDNVIERLTLFDNLPRPINGGTSVRAIVYAREFANKLLAKIGRNPVRDKYLYDFMREHMMMLSMTCKYIAQSNKNKMQTRFDVFTSPVLSLASRAEKRRQKDTRTTSIFTHLWVVFVRKLLMTWRSPWPIQLFIPMAAALIIGNLQEYNIERYPNNVSSAFVCLGVLSMITHVRTFSLDKTVIKRETESKVGIVPYFIAYNAADLMWHATLPIVFTLPYYLLTLPYSAYGSYYATGLMVVWWSSGMAYLISALPLQLHWCNLIAVFISVVFGAFLQGIDPSINSSSRNWLIHVSYNRWAMEILSATEFKHHDPERVNNLWLVMSRIGICGQQQLDLTAFDGLMTPGRSEDQVKFSYRQIIDLGLKIVNGVTAECDSYIDRAYSWLFIYGVIFRAAAFVVLYIGTKPILSVVVWKRLRRLFAAH